MDYYVTPETIKHQKQRVDRAYSSIQHARTKTQFGKICLTGGGHAALFP